MINVSQQKSDFYFLDGLPLEDDPRHIITEDRAGTCCLILDSLTAEDSGQYTCYATSTMGSTGTLAKVVVQGESVHTHGVLFQHYILHMLAATQGYR